MTPVKPCETCSSKAPPPLSDVHRWSQTASVTGELSSQVGLAWESGWEGEGPEDNLRGGTGISVD